MNARAHSLAHLFCLLLIGGALSMNCNHARPQAAAAETENLEFNEKRQLFQRLLSEREQEGGDVSTPLSLGKRAKYAHNHGDHGQANKLLSEAITMLQPEFSEQVAPSPSTAPAPDRVSRKGVVLRWPSDPLQYDDPDIDIVQFDVDWAILEPREGEFEWGALDQRISEARRSGKRVAVALWTHSYSGSRSPGLPDWVKTRRITGVYEGGKLGEISKQKTLRLTYPVKWDPVYREKWAKFVLSFADRYGDAFEYIQITETALAFRENSDMEEKWEEAGFTLEKYKAAVREDIDLFASRFPQTQIMLAINQVRGTSQRWLQERPEEIQWMWDVAEYAASRGVGFINPGLRAWDNPPQSLYVWDIFRKYEHTVPLGLVINPRAVTRGDMTILDVTKKGFQIADVNYMVFPSYWLTQPGGKTAIAYASSQLKRKQGYEAD